MSRVPRSQALPIRMWSSRECAQPQPHPDGGRLCTDDEMKRAKLPGNVLLEDGEANLPRQSVVVVSQVSTVDKSRLGAYIGSLTQERVHQILEGMQFTQVFSAHHNSS